MDDNSERSHEQSPTGIQIIRNSAAKPAAAEPAPPPAPVATGTPGNPSRMILTIDGHRHDVLVEKIEA